MSFETTRHRFGKIPAAVSYSGISRPRLYQLAAAHPGLFRKNGKATLVDFDVLDQILDGLPVAKIKPVVRRAAAAV
jgi:hypothetical protein